ncbi:hypothetical protein [Microseira sp. BLCC-F43]|jgi:hypothetical protein|uniref:hypothetical protein n=1 Tax=Microseira sp. BLCC-F43 TaxID=3153602 RepID=UPI0035B9A5D8
MVKIQLPITNYQLPITNSPVMHQTCFIRVAQSILGSTLLATAGLAVKIDAAVAQSSIPNCQLPKPGEYLLLVESKTPRSRELVRQTVPNTTNLSVCRYSDNVVTRIGGFADAEEVQKWVRYLNDIVGLQAFLVEPPVVVQTARETSSQRGMTTEGQVREQTVVSQNIPAFNPQPLGRGYAILVDFFNKPEIAEQVQRLVGKEVGLVSFAQRPYLLVLHTTNDKNATNTFELLSERGFFAMMVDGRQVTLLRGQVLPNQPRN